MDENNSCQFTRLFRLMNPMYTKLILIFVATYHLENADEYAILSMETKRTIKLGRELIDNKYNDKLEFEKKTLSIAYQEYQSVLPFQVVFFFV